VSGEFGADYDSIVCWERRLARETPLFERLFEEHGVTSLADVGCGTAKHAVTFAGWGIEVWGLDPDEGMLAAARGNAHDAGANIHFALAGFGEVARTAGQVDAVTSLGNAFMHAGDTVGVGRALADFAAALRPGGLLVVHMLNQDRIENQGLRSLPPIVRSTPDGELVVLKLIDHEDDSFIFEFVQMRRLPREPEAAVDEPSEWVIEPRRSRHLKILSDTMRSELESAGFAQVRVLGDHTGRPLDIEEDESAIWVAVKR
jgi:SAM-dependent methyltransferase